MDKYKYEIIEKIEPKFLKIQGVKLDDRDFIFERIPKRSASVMFLYNADYTKLFLVKQFRFGCLKEMWEVPAGIIEDGLTPVDNALKEIEEETGYRKEDITDIIELPGGYVSPGYTEEYMHIFKMRIKEGALPGEKNLDEHELISDEGFFTLEEAMEMGAFEDIKTNMALIYMQMESMKK